MTARTILLLGALSVFAGCGGGTAAQESTMQNSASPPQSDTPTPAPWTAESRAAASERLSSTFASPLFANAGLVVLAGDGATIFTRNADHPLMPASTLKLLVAATALDALGSARRFETSFVATDLPDADGTVQGPLWLVGGGDPVLSTDELRNGVAVLARSGVRRIAGPLVVDATAFSGPEQNPGWDPSDLAEDYAAGTSAISLNWDVAEFRVVPTEPGELARIEVRPHNDNVTVAGHITTSSAGYDSDVTIVRTTSPTLPALRNEFRVGGTIPAGEPQSFYKPVLGIASYVGGATAAMLSERGIALDGGVQTGAAPLAARPIWTHRSKPLGELVRQMLVFSDNHIAEQLLRIVGFERFHSGTDSDGLRAERAYLLRSALPLDGLHVVDASGLSPHDHIPPIELARVLLAALRSRDGETYLNALPRVGMDGTVRRRHVTAALGRARAKSGHIDEVNALAGTVLTRRHGRVVFAFLINGPYSDAGAVEEGIDHALDALAML